MHISSGFTSFSRVVAAGLLISAIILSGCSESDNGSEPTPDKTAPTVSLSASSDLVLADGDVLYTADASDNEGVTLVEFYDGSSMIGSDDTDPYEITISYTETDNGIHDPWARAKDAAGNSKDSDTLSVIVAINVTAEFENPGFTDDATGWTLHNFDPWSGWTDEAGNPPGCFRLNEYGSCEVDPGIQQEVSGFVPGITYQITGEYRPYVNWVGNQYAESFVVTVDSTVVGSFPRGPNGLDWSPFTAEFTATEFIHTIGFWAEHSCDDSSYELDNVSLSIKPGT
jgi:chitinase